MATNPTTVCKFNKFGYCRYGNSCQHRHIDIICDINSCEILSCEKRHPKKCRYWQDYGRCKFGSYCSYLHVTSTEMCFESSIEGLRKNFLCVEASICELKLELGQLKEHFNEKIMMVKDDLEKKWLDTGNQLTALDEVADTQKQQMEVLSGKVANSDEVLENVKGKLYQLFCQVFNSTRGQSTPQSYVFSPMMSTPPPSTAKKRTP